MAIVSKTQQSFLSFLSKFEDLFGFVQGFMKQAAYHLANRRELQRVVQNGRFLEAEGRYDKGVKRVYYFRQGYLPLGKGRGSCQADYLVSADQEIPY